MGMITGVHDPEAPEAGTIEIHTASVKATVTATATANSMHMAGDEYIITRFLLRGVLGMEFLALQGKWRGPYGYWSKACERHLKWKGSLHPCVAGDISFEEFRIKVRA